MHNGARDWSFWWCDACVTQPIFFTQDESSKEPPKKLLHLLLLLSFFSSPIFLHAEVVAHWQINLLWSWLICMLPFFHTMLHWMSTTGSNRDGMQITSDFRRKIIGFLIYWFLKIYTDTTVFENIPKCLNWKLR